MKRERLFSAVPFFESGAILARLENEYIDLRIDFDRFVESLVSDAVENLPVIKNGLTPTQFFDDVYSFLSERGFQDVSKKFVFDSIRIGRPDYTEKQFYKEYAYSKDGNLLLPILDGQTSERLHKALMKNAQPLNGRIDRLKRYAAEDSVERIAASLSDLNGTIEAKTTIARKITGRINKLQRTGSRDDLTIAQKDRIAADIAILEERRKIALRGRNALRKEFEKFSANYDVLEDRERKKAFDSLLQNIEKDVRTNQTEYAVRVSVENAAGYNVKRFGQTEYVSEVTAQDVASFKEEQKALPAGMVFVVSYTLSPDHDIFDICDEHANRNIGYGAGNYPIEAAPIPIEDTHPNCKCQLKRFRIMAAK